MSKSVSGRSLLFFFLLLLNRMTRETFFFFFGPEKLVGVFVL